jgi:NAD(P)-dependent dehydrogenase (short-subunit alcohol dehydrogenase family)
MAVNEGDVVVVTGASAGVGRAVAQAFGARRAAVALVARDESRLSTAATEIKAAGGSALSIPTDVADWKQVERAAERAEKELGPISVWVNDAMVSVFARFTDVDPDEFNRVTDVTYLGVINGTREALRRMVPRNRGVIIQVGSALAYRGIPLQSAYCGAKHAIQGFTESVRSELYHDGSMVRISMVQLPAVNTPQFDWSRNKMPRRPQPVPPIYQPEVAADAIVWTADHPRRHVYVGGTTTATIFANKFVPGLLDRYLGWRGFDSQQVDEPNDADRRDNLFSPVPGPFGAHGRFDDRSRTRSLQFWATTHRSWIATATVSLALAVLGARRAAGNEAPHRGD